MTCTSAGDKFSLNDAQEGAGELLTHMGRTLGAGDTHEVSHNTLSMHNKLLVQP